MKKRKPSSNFLFIKRVLQNHYWLLFLMLFFLCHKVYILLNSEITLYSDDAIYAEIARFAIQGKWNLFFHPTWPPLFPALSSLVYFIFKDWEKSLQLVSIISSVALIIPIYLLFHKTLSKSHAIIGIILISFLNPILNTSLLPLSDMLATFLVLFAVVLVLISLMNKNNYYLYISSFLFGLLYLTRSEGFMFFIITFSLCCLNTLIIQIHKTSRTNRLPLIPITYLVIFLVTISPYLISTKHNLGRWSLSHKASAQIKQGHAFQIRENTGLTWSQEVVSVKYPNYKSHYFSGGMTHVLEYSDWYWFWFKQKFFKWTNVYLNIFPKWFYMISIMGIINMMTKKQFMMSIYLLGLLSIGIFTTIFGTAISDIRYLLWTIPLFIYLYFQGFDLLRVIKTKYIANNKLRTVILFVAVLVLVAFNNNNTYVVSRPDKYANNFTNQYKRQEIKMAGDYMKKYINPSIMMRHEGVEFYSDGNTIYIPQDKSIDDTLLYGSKLGAEYIVAWTEELAGNKELLPLLDNSFHHNKLTKEYEIDAENRKLIIYKISK